MTTVKKNISVFLIVTMVSLLLGCSHKTLSVFFDGVPMDNDSTKMLVKKVEKKPDSIIVKELAENTDVSEHSSHPPFASKKCRTCHDPERKGIMIESQPALCYQCHDVIKEKFEHGPVVSGNCTQCHSPHSSDNPKLLLRVGQALCLNCHESDRLSTIPEHENTDQSPCTSCHNPHGGNKRYFLN